MPQGVGSFSTPGKPNSGNFIFLHFWIDISIFDRHLTFMDQPICHGSWDQTIPPKLLTGRPVNNLGIVDSSHQGPGPWKLGPGPGSQNPNSVGTSCQSSHPPNVAIPAPRCGGIWIHPVCASTPIITCVPPHLGAGIAILGGWASERIGTRCRRN